MRGTTTATAVRPELPDKQEFRRLRQRGYAWTYNNGILNSVTQHVDNSDGSSTDYRWYNNADGSLVIYNWANYANGSASSMSEQVCNASGVLVSSYQWSFYADGSVNSYTEYDYTADGSQVDNAAYVFHGSVSQPTQSATTVTAFQTISCNSDGSLASFVVADLNSDGTSTYESFNQAVPGNVPASNTLADYNADGSLANLTQWYYWQTYGSHVSNGGTDIVQTDYNADGSYASHAWSYFASGALGSFVEGAYDASGNQLSQESWSFGADGSLFDWRSFDANGFTTSMKSKHFEGSGRLHLQHVIR